MLTRVAIDGHVHLREPSHDAAALVQAAANFAQWCPAPSRIGVLMLAEATGEDAYRRLESAADLGHGLRVRPTDEAESLWVEAGEWTLLVVAGRQVVTAERLEVLALATARRFDDGLALDALLPMIAAGDAVPVLPWGCGKWLGARRVHVQAAVRRAASSGLLLGDNAGRPAAWNDRLLAGADAQRVLRGTDPLPLAGHWRRIGRFGCRVDLQLSRRHPAAGLRRALRDPAVRLEPYGRLQRPAAFLLDQLRLRLTGGVRADASAARVAA